MGNYRNRINLSKSFVSLENNFMMYTSIEKEFMSKALKRGNILLFEPEIAISFIRQCKAKNIVILGIDGFQCCEEKIQPFLEHSVDYSELSRQSYAAIYKIAEDFINEKKNKGLVFEIVVDDN